MVRLKNYFNKWVELLKVEKLFDGAVEMMVREQFTNCTKGLFVYLNERSPKTLDELVILVKKYLMVHGKKLSSKDVMVRRGETRGFGRGKSPESFGAVVRCSRCGGERHRAAKCVSRLPEGHRRDGQQGRKLFCNRCGAFGHGARDCRSTLGNQQISRSGFTGGKASRSPLRVGCAMRVRKELPPVRLTEDDDLLELKSGEKINVLIGACMGAEMTERMPVVTGKVGDRCVEDMRDIGCNGVIIKKDLVSQKELTENEGC